MPGQPRRAEERQQHLQDSGQGRTADAGDPAHRRQPVLAVDVERRQGHRLRGQLRHLEAGRRVGQDERNQAGHHLRREEERGRVRGDQRTRSTRSTFRRPAAARSFPRADRSSRLRPSAATSRASRRTRWRRAIRRRSGLPTASSSRLSPIARDATRSGSATPKAARRRRSPTSTTRRARSCGRRIRRRCSTRPPTRSSTATTSPTARRPSSPRAMSAASARSPCRPTANGSLSPSRIERSAPTSTSCRSRAAKSATSPTTACSIPNQRHLDCGWPLPRLHLLRGREHRHRVAGRHQHDDGVVGAVAARSGPRSDESRHRQRGAGARGRSGRAPEHGPWRFDGSGQGGGTATARHRTFASTGTAWRAARVSSLFRERRSADSRRRPKDTRLR